MLSGRRLLRWENYDRHAVVNIPLTYYYLTLMNLFRLERSCLVPGSDVLFAS